MSPSAGLSPLRVGPEDATAAEAGELVKDVGIHHHAKALIQATTKQMPKELRSAIQRFEYRERSKHLVPEEVLAQAQATVGEEAIARILSARVKGSKTNPYDGHVIILYEAPNQRTARCAVLYDPNTFPKSVEAYEGALREGKVVLPGELSDRADLREALDAHLAENARLAERVKELEAGEPGTGDATTGTGGGAQEDKVPPPPAEPQGIAPEDVPDGVEPGVTPGWPVVNDVILDLPDEVREKLAEAELETQPEEIVLPEGVEAGEPGWPVDAEGNLIALPDEVRQQLIADAEANEEAIERAREQAAEEARAQVATNSADDAPKPVDLSEVALPEGNFDQVAAMLPFLAPEVVQALTLPDREGRSTVRKAAVRELEEREIPLPEGAEGTEASA